MPTIENCMILQVGQNGDVNPKCHSCGKVVFQMERTKAESLVWHKNCFRCVQCSKPLNVDNYQSHESTLYCKPHFKELFLPKPVEETEQPSKIFIHLKFNLFFSSLLPCPTFFSSILNFEVNSKTYIRQQKFAKTCFNTNKTEKLDNEKSNWCKNIEQIENCKILYNIEIKHVIELFSQWGHENQN